MNPTTFLIAGTHSGVGKTTVTFALLSLLAQKGFKVQPFKIGPDFIDGGYHRLAAGKDSINLDLWMMGWKGVEESFREYSNRVEVSVLEGMGALYDGKNGTTSGSSAEIARRLDVPVVLVVDIWGMTVTAGAVIEGLMAFDPRVKIAGILLNRAGSRAHYEMVMKSLKPSLRRKVVGYLPRLESFAIPERHLGLKTIEENEKAEKVKAALVEVAEQTVDLDKWTRFLQVQKGKSTAAMPPFEKGGWGGISRSRSSNGIRLTPPLSPSFRGGKDQPSSSPAIPKIRIGVARDEAFCFYYAENLGMLEEAGAQLVYFSPLRDRRLPPGLKGLYFGGGYPESFPKELAANQGLKKEILRRTKEGMPVYAECGGLMYLSKSLAGFDGEAFPMVGALPLKVKMEKNHLTIRYVELKAARDCLLGPQGTPARGHEFHHSRIVSNRFKGKPAYDCVTSTGKNFTEGFQSRNLLASYIHLHFISNPRIAAAFMDRCERFDVDKPQR